jgi:hypothetical protein
VLSSPFILPAPQAVYKDRQADNDEAYVGTDPCVSTIFFAA